LEYQILSRIEYVDSKWWRRGKYGEHAAVIGFALIGQDSITDARSYDSSPITILGAVSFIGLLALVLNLRLTCSRAFYLFQDEEGFNQIEQRDAVIFTTIRSFDSL
jgi:hypothetical protein